MALLLALSLQAPSVEEILREFDAQGAVEPADLDALLDALEQLGASALLPISEALAADLRDGMAAASAPALIDALVGRGTLEPLRAAFRDPKTPAAGRLEIARALDDLGDDSWREETRRMSRDAGLDPALRLRAAALLELAEVVDDPRESVTPEPARRMSTPRKKPERPAREPGTMGAALFIGGSLLVLGTLLWTLRRKD
ncbi:MAG TPA: hypothetical protein VF950_04705 [Planctomycetota bacterium]